jgi:GH25 family lysozyme M1 (1,4-beta-N-acetylmuramidase)
MRLPTVSRLRSPLVCLALAMSALTLAPAVAAADPTPSPTTSPTSSPTTSPTTSPATSPATSPMPPVAGAPDPSIPDALRRPEDWGLVNGIDTSKWQHPGGAPIDWNAVRGAGVSFVINKATEGSSLVDPWFSIDHAGAGAAGLYRSAYHYARPTLPVGNAAADARFFVSVAGILGGTHDLPPVLDLEASGGLGPADLAAWTATWLNTVQSLTGRRPIIYTGYNFWHTYMANTSQFASSPLWYARYNTDTEPGPLFGGWSAWTIWQWSDSGQIAGIPGGAAVDLDKFGGSYAQLAALAGTGRPAPETGPVTSRNADGRLEVFTVGSTGSVFHAWQVRPNGSWSAWMPLSGGRVAGSVSVATNADGRLEVFGLTDVGAAVHAWQVTPNGDWSAWMPLNGTLTASTIGVAGNPDGRLEAFGRAPDGALAHTWQVAPNGGWSGWWPLGGSLTGPPTVANGVGGRIDVFTRNADDSIGHIHQADGGGWSDWESPGGSTNGPPAVTVATTGAFAIAYPDVHVVKLLQQGAPDASWVGPRTIASVTPVNGATVAIDANADDRLEVFAIDQSSLLGHTWATSAALGSTWSGFAALGYGPAGTPTVDRNADGRLEVFAGLPDGSVVHAWQTPVSATGWSGLVRL